MSDLRGRMDDVERLKNELRRAYRALFGFDNARREGKLFDGTAVAYHSPTIAAARRFVREGALDGAAYFEGKSVEVLRRALSDKEQT